jgi:phage shock protein PspC (stress-responsive transcriptional regulator)
MIASIAQKIVLKGKEKILKAAYSHRHGLIFGHDGVSRILVFNISGILQQIIELDKLDHFRLMEARNDQFVVGTREGLVRIYDISEGLLKLSKIFICYMKNHNRVSAYKLVGSETVEKVIFISSKTICEYDISKSAVTEVDKIEEDENSFIHSRPNLSNGLKMALIDSTVADMQVI